jgi:hypothetical protein
METNNQRLLHTFAALADLGQENANTSDFEEMLRSSFHLLLGSVAIRRGGRRSSTIGSGCSANHHLARIGTGAGRRHSDQSRAFTRTSYS